MPNVPFPKLDIGGRSLILHKIEAKKKDNELLEEEVVKLEQELKEEEAELEAQSKTVEEEMAKV